MSVIYPNRLLDQQIRILELQPGSYEEVIKIRLITSEIFNNPGFEAVSYVWGDQTVRKQTNCEGIDIAISENLHDVLLRMRLPQTPRLIWADAICINQNDLDERNQQVSLMRDIFSQASRVVVWLGRDREENLHLAVRAINIIYQHYLDYVKSQNLNMASSMSFKHLESVPIGTNSSPDAAFDDETWSSISHFFARQWFERIWCIQEIILGQHGVFLLETCQIPWEHIGVAAAVLMAQISKRTYFGLHNRQCDEAIQCISAAQLYFHDGKGTILDNLETFCTRKATDPRDIVYGLLGLQDHRGILDPDYGKNTAEIYVDVVMATVHDNGLKFLSNVQHEDKFQHQSDLPSWAPYWPRQRSVSYLARGKWHAGGQQLIDVLFPSRRELTIQGIVFEEIIFVSNIYPKSFDDYSLLHPFPDLILALWHEYTSDLSNSYSQTDFRMLARTLTAGYTATGESVHELDVGQSLRFYSDFIAFIDNILQFTGQKSRAFIPPDLAAFDGDWQRYRLGVRYACRSRRLFRTREGFLGLGPACTGIGDRVCVLKGGQVPYVLRPTEGSFYFLGECYIDNIMRGELFQGAKIEHSKLRMLTLK